MAKILKGAPVAAALNERMEADVAALKEYGVEPCLAIVRVGEREDDLSYERGAMKRCAAVGVAVKNVVLPTDIESDAFFAELDALNHDAAVHGILLFRPLPRHLDGERARQILAPEKKTLTDAQTAVLQECLRIQRWDFHPVLLRRRWRSSTITACPAPENARL